MAVRTQKYCFWHLSCESWTERKSGEWERKKKRGAEKGRENERDTKKEREILFFVFCFVYYRCPLPEANCPLGKYYSNDVAVLLSFYKSP